MGRLTARRTKRLWTDEEKRSICLQTRVPGVSVAQVVRRYAMNANLIFKWLRDPRYKPEAGTVVEESASDAACFLPIEIIGATRSADTAPAVDPTPGQSMIDIVGGHRLRIFGTYDPETLARLIRGLSG